MIDEDKKSQSSESDVTIYKSSPSSNLSSSYSSLVGNCSFLVFGVATLIAWTSIVTNSEFFESKFHTREDLQTWVIPSMSLCSMIPLICSNITNLGILWRFPAFLRIVIAKSTILVGFVIMCIICYTNLPEPLFFSLLMILSFIMNFCTPVLLSAFFEYVGLYPLICVTWFVVGQALSGVFVSLLQLILIPINLEKSTASLIYFIIASIFVLCSLLLYIYLHKTNYHLKNAAKILKITSKDAVCKPITDQLKLFYSISLYKWKDCLTCFLIYFVTLFIFPKLCLSVVTAYPKTNWANYFTVFHCFVMFNVFDMLGRYSPHLLRWPKPGTIWMIVVALSRFLFFVLYLFCYRPGSNLSIKTVFNSDIWPILFMSIFALTNGHLTSIVFGVPFSLEIIEDQQACSAVMVLLLGLGLSTGAAFAFLIPLL